RQVRYAPELVVIRLATLSCRLPVQRIKALLDGVLVAAAERRVDQVADVGVAGVDRDAVAVLGYAAQSVDVADVQFRVDSRREKVHRQVDDVDVAGALAVAEQGALDALGAGHDAELGRGNARAP